MRGEVSGYQEVFGEVGEFVGVFGDWFSGLRGVYGDDACCECGITLEEHLVSDEKFCKLSGPVCAVSNGLNEGFP